MIENIGFMNSFKEILSYMQIDKKYNKALVGIMRNKFSDLNKENEIKRTSLKSSLENTEAKLEEIEEKYLYDDSIVR